MTLFLIAGAAFSATLLGGLFAIRFKDRLHLIVGFSAGAVIGVAFFDLLPEAIELTEGYISLSLLTGIIALGFLIFMVLDRTIILHSHHNDHDHGHSHAPNHDRGLLGASSLSLHSFLDGVVIGLAWQVSSVVGLVVTISVLAHDFSDGINTVNVILKNGGEKIAAFKWLTIDALAPVAGIIVAQFFTLSTDLLGVALAVFCGFFIYIGASDLLPESHHQHPTWWTSLATIFGMAMMFVIINLAS
jgi:zinc transporter ZupT